MFIWLIATLLVALFALIGYFKGAIRMLISLLGFFIAVACALPLAPTLKPLVPLMKVEHPLWSLALPPLMAFFLVELVFVIIGFVVHYLIARQMHFSADEYTQASFKRLNQRSGLCVGIAAAFAHVIAIGVIIYVVGYPAAQLAVEGDTATGMVGTIGLARMDLQKTGLDKLAAKFDPAPPRFYQTSDILGLIYNNPVLTGRLASYPAYLALEEKQEFKDIGGDTDYQQMIQTKTDVVTFLENPKTQAILNNPEIMKAITEVDLKDLRTYLETGKTPKYDEEPLLGRWRVDANAVLRQAKKAKPDITAQELSTIKGLANSVLAGILLTATPDNQIFIKAPPLPEPPKPPADGQEAAAPQPDVSMQQRYGIAPAGRSLGSPTSLASGVRQRLGGGPQGGAQRGVAPVVQGQVRATPPPPKITAADVRVAGAGSWKLEDGKYEIAIQSDKGASLKASARLDDDRLYLASGPVTLVFEKVR